MSKKELIANKALAEELAKRFKFIEKAHQQILVRNYGIAKSLLGKVLHENLSVTVVEMEASNETEK